MDTVLSWVGAALSILGTGITIFQVNKAKTIKEEISSERKKITYHNVIEELKKAQPHIRQLVSNQRGTNKKMLNENIQSSFDATLSSLDDGIVEEKSVRELLKKAQTNLNDFLQDKENVQLIQECQSLVQDSISKISKTLKGD